MRLDGQWFALLGHLASNIELGITKDGTMTLFKMISPLIWISKASRAVRTFP
jgi:hypothetical protein